jgi:hypothetical protein
LAIEIAPARFFAASKRPRLIRLAKRWNRRDRPTKATVYRSIDPSRIGVVAQGFVPTGRSVPFQQFAHVLDDTIASTAEFFDALTSNVEPPPHSRATRLPDAS